MKPPIITLLPVSTNPRVEILASLALPEASRLAVPRSYTSTNAMPVVLFLPRTMAV